MVRVGRHVASSPHLQNAARNTPLWVCIIATHKEHDKQSNDLFGVGDVLSNIIAFHLKGKTRKTSATRLPNLTLCAGGADECIRGAASSIY